MLLRELFEAEITSYTERDHAKALDKTGFFGDAGAGCIILAKSTGRVLLAYRSNLPPPHDVQEPHTWATIGGAIDRGEDPMEAAKREISEELGYRGPVKMLPLYVFQKGSFRYSNFLGIVEDEFSPKLNWENEKAEWFEVGDWPSPLHFGLKALLSDPESIEKITAAMKNMEVGKTPEPFGK